MSNYSELRMQSASVIESAVVEVGAQLKAVGAVARAAEVHQHPGHKGGLDLIDLLAHFL